MAYTTGSTFSLQTGYNLPPLIYPANGMTSSTRTGGIVSSSDPYTANITSSFLTDISNMTITAEQLALIAENEPSLLLSVQPRIQSTVTIGQMIINKIIEKANMPSGTPFNVYGVPGASWYDVDDYLENATITDPPSLRYIHASNETAAIYMASYYAEMINKVGVTFCTSGPGTTMATTAVNSIYNETKSCVCFFGMSSSNFQSADMSVMEAITQKCIYIYEDTLNPDQLVDEAFRIAKQGYKFPNIGPVAVFVHQKAWRRLYYTTGAKLSFNVAVNPVDNFLNTIFSNINQDSKIIIRVGERVDIDNIRKLALLTKTYKNIYLHLITTSKMYVNIDEFSDWNVAVEGPYTNTVVNDNYTSATLVVQIGTGTEYPATTFLDVKPLMTTPNSQLFYALDQELVYFPASSNSSNKLMTDVSYFAGKFADYMNTKSPTFFTQIWPNTKNAQIAYINTLINYYKTQVADINNPPSPSSPLTSIAVVTNVLDVIYGLAPNTNTTSVKTINDNNLYSFDVGFASFYGDTMMYHSKINHVLNFSEFSPIGCSIATIPGRIDSGTIQGDVVCFVGDGGFLNMPGYMIDLRRALNDKSKRCLFVLLNDQHYSLVSLAEQQDLGKSTIVTVTSSMQDGSSGDYLYNLTCAFMGDSLKQSKNYKDIIRSSAELTDLRLFVTNWYNNSVNYTSSGFYFINYKTNSIPRHI
jgi:thiamine pyrophosphate-dependent acetolactate synthase large subunit-like protein